jgi:Cu/Ag efflux protein CusF
MRKILLFCAATFLAQAAFVQASAQATQTSATQGDAAKPARQRVVGEVTAVDSSASGLTVKTDAGETVNVTTDPKTTIRRLPAGETSLDKATSATFADVRVGDRVLAVGVGVSGGLARQLILTTRAAATQGRDDAHRLFGRVVSVDASRKLIVVQTRGRDAAAGETVNVDASNGTRLLHYAPDSSRAADAQAATFADIRVGDQLRATGERTPEGSGFKAGEIIAGSFTRVGGQVVSVDAARNELTLKNEQTGQTFRVTVGGRTTLRRVTPEFIKTMNERAEQMRAQREARRAEGGGQSADNNNGARGGGGRPEGQGRGGGQGNGGGREGRRGGGGGFGGGNMFDGLPAITLADLKKGDGVMVTATPGADASSVTAVSIVTGDADFLRRMQQRGGEGRQRGMSPGLPGDVIGGGTGGNREPPR